MIKSIALNEIRSAYRNRTTILLTILFWLLLLVSAIGGYKNYRQSDSDRKQAKADFRHEWEEQKANPHSAAHFGTYLFKPFSFIGLFDTGLNNYTGISYRVEAHNQAEMNYAAAQDSDTELRFGELTIASLMQLFVPLLIIFLCFNSISLERERHTLKLLYSQGLKAKDLVYGKIAGNFLLVLLITLPAFMVMLLSVALTEPSFVPRTAAFVLSYTLYFLLLVTVFVLLSAISSSSKNALLVSLGVWVFFFVMFPKITSGLADQMFPLPSRGAFNKAVETGNSKGINGDKDRTGRYKDYLAKTLAKYKVDTVTKLPVNFDGLSMQYGEDYLSKVYQNLSRDVEKKISSQQLSSQLFSFIDPFLAMQQLSMGYAGTDYEHHVHFHKQAQRYRDNFIRQLNLKMAYGDSQYLKYDYEVGPEFFKSMKDFNYSQPGLKWVLSKHLIALIALLFWLAISLLLVIPVSNKIAVN